MFTIEAESAILDLQRRAEKSRDNYTLECIDRALDEIVRNPLNTSPAPFQVRSAMAHAKQVVKSRRALAPTCDIDDPAINLGSAAAGYVEVEYDIWLEQAPLTDRDRTLLQAMSSDTGVADLAEARDTTPQRMQEAVSRARRKARACRAEEVAA